ncbi:hypothetical protein [Aminobacter sp. DSM 101952]|uniref:hypothetical protein n=1 Tax=Aminobacter sp. DSM 101952 TaxID=2735891 RepID=UPI0012E38353|nr:hypothetical protein [Aminobacter sp. DSM 101952]
MKYEPNLETTTSLLPPDCQELRRATASTAQNGETGSMLGSDGGWGGILAGFDAALGAAA